MVFIIDEGSNFDAPVEKVWRYVSTGSPQEHQHKSMQNIQMSMDGQSPVMAFETEGPGGAKMKQKLKFTMIQPIGYVLEYIEGPMTGSKSITYYHPKGSKTGITVVGEYISPMMSEEQLKKAVAQQLEMAFNEDQENLKRYK